MSTIVANPDQTLTVTLTEDEQRTISYLPPGQLEAYLTLWLSERADTVWRDRMMKLSPQKKRAVLSALQTAENAPQ